MGEMVLSHPAAAAPAAAPHAPDADAHRAARRALRGQIARLDAEIGVAVVAAFAARGHGEGSRPVATSAAAGRLLDLGELEEIRDDLAGRLHAVRAANAARARRQAQAQARLAQMLADPGHHRRRRITLAELGEPGCGAYAVRPRLGLIGMLAGWWQVKLSSGCPLSRRP